MPVISSGAGPADYRGYSAWSVVACGLAPPTVPFLGGETDCLWSAFFSSGYALSLPFAITLTSFHFALRSSPALR